MKNPDMFYITEGNTNNAYWTIYTLLEATGLMKMTDVQAYCPSQVKNSP